MIEKLRNFLVERLIRALMNKKYRKGLRAAVTGMAAVVVFVTTYCLILPALTLELEKADGVAGMYLEQEELLLDTEETGDKESFSADSAVSETVERDGDPVKSQANPDDINFAELIEDPDERSLDESPDEKAETEPASEHAEESTEAEPESGLAEESTEAETESGFAEENMEAESEEGIDSLDLGIAVIESAAGETLPAEADGHAYALRGNGAEKVNEEVESYLLALSSSGRRQLRKARGKSSAQTRYQVFEIGLDGVDEEAYEDGFRVTVQLPEPIYGRDFGLYHVHENAEGERIVSEISGEAFDLLSGSSDRGEEKAVSEFSFVTENFSEFVLRYTVDFTYAVDGRTYDFTLSGGRDVLLADLVEALGMTQGTDFESTEEFLRYIDDVTFSDPSLVLACRVDSDTTVGAIKEAHGVESAYSADLTEADIAAVNGSAVPAGAWILLSLQAFDTDEALTITMKNGDVITVHVTDAHIKRTVMTASGETWNITVTYGEDAGIPDNADLFVEEITRETTDYRLTYDEYVSLVQEAVGPETGRVSYARLFNIKIVDPTDHNVKYQPAEGTTVDVKIELADRAEGETGQVVHIEDGANEGYVVDSSTESGDNGQIVEFSAEGFSVYAIILTEKYTYSTPFMKISVESPDRSAKLLRDVELSTLAGMEVVEAYAVTPYSAQVKIRLSADDLPEAEEGEFFEIYTQSHGKLTSYGEVKKGSEVSFNSSEAEVFALVRRPLIEQTIVSEEGITLTGIIPQEGMASVEELTVEMDPDAVVNLSYDIKILDHEGNEWQPAEGDTVEVIIPYDGTQEELEEYYWTVYHTSDGVTEQLYDAYPVDGGIRFTTKSFSTFTLRAHISGSTYGRPTTVHFVDHLGNEIQGAVTGNIAYTYQQYYDLYQYANSLDSSIAEDYDFSRVYVQLGGSEQKNFRYMYLGTIAEVDGSGSGYRVYMFMNNLDECKSGGTYNGTWYTGTGSSSTGDVYIVFDHVTDVSFNKTDSDGYPVSGAEFTLYNDASCVSAVVYNGKIVTAASDSDGKVDFGRIPYGTYYMKETVTPAGFKEGTTVFTVNVDNSTHISDIINEDDDGSVVVGETKTMNIAKTWSDNSDHSQDQVTIKLFNAGNEAGSVTLNTGNDWKQSVENLDPTVYYMVTETNVTSGGEDVTNGWIPEITSVDRTSSIGYYRANDFQVGREYVFVYTSYGQSIALSRDNNNSLTGRSITTSGGQITSFVNNNMTWKVTGVTADGVVSFQNVGSGLYLDRTSTSRWGLTTSAPQFVRYTVNGNTIQFYYRENIDAGSNYYLNAPNTASTGSGTNFTVYQKINVRTVDVTVNNKPAEYPVMIKKLEYSSDKVIPGTAFSLYTEEEYNKGSSGTATYTGLTSGSDGYLTAEGTTHIHLMAGTYYLVETQAAERYVDLSKPVKFTISRGGRFTARSAEQEFTDYSYASTVTDGGTTYPLLSVPNQKKVTLTFKAEDGVDRVQLESGSYLSISGNGTKEMTVIIPEVTGSSISVKGIAEDGKAVSGWTINSETVKLTTEKTINTAIVDDSAAANTWTDRTYHVWAETEKKVNVTKEVDVLGSVKKSDIDTTVYFVVWDHAANRNVLDENGNILIKSISIVDGVPQGTVTFDGLTSGTYSVWEVDANGRDMSAGTVVIGHDIAVSKITTRHGDDSGNRVNLTDTLTEDGITVVNTYNHESDVVDWTITKQWFMEKNTVNQSDKASTATSAYPIPTGASSTLVLYRKDDQNTPIQTIILDGTVDTNGETEAWKATFSDIPIKDSDGNTIEYVVKETAFAPEKSNEGLYIYPYTAETDHDGGTIRNAVIYGNIRIFKQFEIQPHIDITDMVGNLTIKVTGSHGYSETFTFPAADNYNPQLEISDVPAGVYHVAEVGYEDLITGRKWNSVGSYIYASIMPEGQSSLQGTERKGETETDVLVGTKGGSDDTVEVRIKNDYLKLDIKATKVWADSATVSTHEDVIFTLYRTGDGGTKTNIGESKTISGTATGDDLTVVWEQQDQQYHYVLEEDPVYGYTTEITGDALNGFTVTNIPKQTTQLTVVKKVEGVEAAKQKTFLVKITPDGFSDKAQTLELKPSSGEDSQTVILPYGTYTIEELLVSSEDTAYSIEIDGYDRATTISVNSGMREQTVSKQVDLQTSTATVTVTNSYKRQTTDVVFKKVDGDNHSTALSADFQMEYSTDNEHYATINNGQVEGVTDSVFNIAQSGTALALVDGYYRLTERKEPDGYHLLTGTIVFSVSDGVISLVSAQDGSKYVTELTQEVIEDGQTVQTVIGLELYNYIKRPVSIWKTDLSTQVISSGASFALYKKENFNDDTQSPIDENQIVISGTTGANGILSLGNLDEGEYRLVETKAPAGYDQAQHAIKIFVSIDRVTAIQETGNSDVYYKGDTNWVTGQVEKTAQIRVWNNPGVVLPETGGPGTRALYLLGGMLMAASAVGIVMRRRRKVTS